MEKIKQNAKCQEEQFTLHGVYYTSLSDCVALVVSNIALGVRRFGNRCTTQHESESNNVALLDAVEILLFATVGAAVQGAVTQIMILAIFV